MRKKKYEIPFLQTNKQTSFAFILKTYNIKEASSTTSTTGKR